MADRDAKYWCEQIRNAQRFQILYGGAREWKRYKDYYRHKFAKGVLPVNKMFSICRSTVAQTYFRNPSITLTPQKPGLLYWLHSKTVEAIDRYLLRELFVKNELKKMTQDAFLSGTAVGFNGYDSEYGWSTKTAEQGIPASLTQVDKKGYKIEYNAFINPGMPWFLRSRPDDVVWPWGCEDSKNAEWVAMRFLRPLEDLKADRKYSVPDDLQGSFVPIRTGPEGEQTLDNYYDTLQQKTQWVECWQVHDAKTGKIYVVSMNSDKVFREDTDEMQIEGLPVETLVFNPDPDYIYGIPDARIIEPQLLEGNEIRTQAMKHRRIDILKILVKKGVLTESQIDALMSEAVKGVVSVETDGALADAVMHLAGGAGGIMQDMAFAMDQADKDIRESVGFSRVQSGEFQGKTHISSTETEEVMARSDIRIDEKRDALADLLTNVVRKFNQTVFKYWTLPQVVDIVGPDGAKYWIQYTGPELKGEYNIKVDPSSGQPVDPQIRRREAMEMAKAWSEMNMAQAKMGAPVPAEIQRYFFSQYEGLNVEKLLKEQGMQEQIGSAQQPVPPQYAAQQIQQRLQKQ